jgi:hypothetical protein
MIEVSMVPRQYIDTCWSRVEPFAKKAAEYTYGRYTSDDIYDSIVEHDYQMWVAMEGSEFKGLVITNIVNYPKRKLLAMQFCGGVDLKLWKEPMLALLKRFGSEMGCDGIESTGRPGWAKVFKNDGYKATWVTYELPFATGE